MLFTRTLWDWRHYVHSTDTENEVQRKQMCSREQVPEKGLKPRCPSPKSIFFLKPCRALLLIHLHESSHPCLEGKELPFPLSILLILWKTVDHSSVGGHSRWSARRILDECLTRNMNWQGQVQPVRPFIWHHSLSYLSSSFLVLSIQKTKIFLRGISRKGERVENVCGSWKSCIFPVNCRAKKNIWQREWDPQIFVVFGLWQDSARFWTLFFFSILALFGFYQYTLLWATSLKWRKLTDHLSHPIFHWPPPRATFLNEGWDGFTSPLELIGE